MNQQLRPEDMESVLLELMEVRDTLKAIQQQTSRMERRLKVAMGVGSQASKQNRPHLRQEDARSVIQSLRGQLESGVQIERELQKYSVKPDLQYIASELGLTNAKLPPKDELVRRISTRLRQAAAISAGISS
jgi:hypothetical protein